MLAGLVAEGEDAVAAMVEAERRHELTADVFERGRSLLLLAEHERRDRQRSPARRHLIEAVDCFERLGARPWVQRAQNELRALGGHVEADDLGVRLTPQELAVARCAANVLSNRKVAEALFLSPRTVAYHLRSVYRKLGIRSRAGLATRVGAEAVWASQ